MPEKGRSWWAKIRVGLVTDPKHERRMGNAIWLYLYLHMYAKRDSADGEIMRKHETIADDMGYHIATIQRRMAKLVKGGYITTCRMQHGLRITINKYSLNDHDGRASSVALSQKGQITQSGDSDIAVHEFTVKSAGSRNAIRGSSPFLTTLKVKRVIKGSSLLLTTPI